MSSPAAGYLWQLAGRPDHPATTHPDQPATCLVCATTTPHAIPARAALGVSFDYTQATSPDSTMVCPACAWALAGKPPHTLRMWSVAATRDRTLPPSHPRCQMPVGPGAHLTNRSDMRAVADLLTHPPHGQWLVTIAVSGQKHVVPYARTSHGPGPWRIRVETCDVTATPTEMAWLLGQVARLRHTGFGPDQIARVDPGTHLSTRDRITAWRHHAEPLTPYRGSPLLTLATLIPTKEHLRDYLDRYADQPQP